MISRWERFLRWLGKPVVYDNVRTFSRHKAEMLSFVHRNRDRADDAYIGKTWNVGPGRIVHYDGGSNTIHFYLDRSCYVSGPHTTLWLTWPAPASSWYPKTGLMELVLKGMLDDSSVYWFLIQKSEERSKNSN